MNGSLLPGPLPCRNTNCNLCACWDRTLFCGDPRDGVHAWKDLCIHRGAKLSLGRISQSEKGECVVCPYHGWEYNSAGECVRIPAHPDQAPPARAQVDHSSCPRKIWPGLGVFGKARWRYSHRSPRETRPVSASFPRGRTHSMRKDRALSKIFSISRTCPSPTRACSETRQMRRSANTQ